MAAIWTCRTWGREALPICRYALLALVCSLAMRMGDWAKGEFLKAGKQPNVDFLCFQYPGTAGSFTFNSDQFAMFKVGEAQEVGQLVLASAVMDKNFQEQFSLAKGSIPARIDIPDTKFDACGKKSMSDLRLALRNDSMLGSFAHADYLLF